MLDAIRVPRAGSGRPRTTRDRVVADRAYSSRKIRHLLRQRKIRTTIPEGRRRPPLDADRRIAFDPVLSLPPADRLARDGQLPVDGVGVHLVRPRRRQLRRHLRQRRVIDRGDGEDRRLRTPSSGPVGAGSPVSTHPHVVSEIR
ncbi:hypothetical protein J7E94_33355 [Streptomyces sp. ISL-94]|nr:hypothetical protein [Streptomyces sp. ISL-94]